MVLKRCPYCGEKAQITSNKHLTHPKQTYEKYFLVQCSSKVYCPGITDVYFTTEYAAVTSWNTRTFDTWMPKDFFEKLMYNGPVWISVFIKRVNVQMVIAAVYNGHRYENKVRPLNKSITHVMFRQEKPSPFEEPYADR